ncbi:MULTISPECIES: WbqC family protein [Proteiniphilum]|uniref:WbqC family protein n=1 Tax=Proteiniphilum TaxID=294702 RepID=UPI001EEAF995|nr:MULTISPECIES: WbqC family protein [Proteiniphilum]ULB36032.1 WbqC family protein [Proteiniphilum propionicum]
MTDRHHAGIILLPSLYLAPVQYYAALFQSSGALIEIQDNYQKQSYRNRCTIAGANGALSLSIPIEKPETAKCKMKDIRIAEHGNWRHLHWNAIISAYNSTPFFQYYEDDFRPFYEGGKHRFLHDFNEQLRELVCRLTGIDTTVNYTTEYAKTQSQDIFDFREAIHPKKPSDFIAPRYYQVFAKKNGFIPNLSIIDLLFNMGNESRLYLRESIW